MLRAEGVYFGQAPSFGKNGREASSTTFLQSLELPHARHLAENPIRTSTSMKQWHFMDKNPFRTSTSMKQRLFMDKNLIRTSTSMKQRHFMDKNLTATQRP